jgi:hypothetical protein
MNQGYDVVEFINGNRSLKPADEPILEAKFRNLPGGKSVEEWLEFLRSNVTILNELSPLQMREFMLDSDVSFYRAGTIVFERNDPGSSLFAIASGSVNVHVSAADPSITIPIGTGLDLSARWASFPDGGAAPRSALQRTRSWSRSRAPPP